MTLIDAGIPGVTLGEEVKVSDYFRKWQFIFQMLPDLPPELTQGKEDLYVGWWFKNKVHIPGAIPPTDVAAYVPVTRLRQRACTTGMVGVTRHCTRS